MRCDTGQYISAYEHDAAATVLPVRIDGFDKLIERQDVARAATQTGPGKPKEEFRQLVPIGGDNRRNIGDVWTSSRRHGVTDGGKPPALAQHASGHGGVTSDVNGSVGSPAEGIPHRPD